MRSVKSWAWNILISIDQFANVALAPVLNRLLRPKSYAEFGHPDETLSSVMGKNVRSGQCRGCKIVCKVLHWFDKDHCEKSIEDDRGRMP